MKSVALAIIVVCAVGFILGLLMFFSPNQLDVQKGSALIGTGIPGILLSCMVIALVDIRDRLAK